MEESYRIGTKPQFKMGKYVFSESSPNRHWSKENAL